eukprot:365535-Chlamydomonas_euryale.AAC.77
MMRAFVRISSAVIQEQMSHSQGQGSSVAIAPSREVPPESVSLLTRGAHRRLAVNCAISRRARRSRLERLLRSALLRPPSSWAHRRKGAKVMAANDGPAWAQPASANVRTWDAWLPPQEAAAVATQEPVRFHALVQAVALDVDAAAAADATAHPDAWHDRVLRWVPLVNK